MWLEVLEASRPPSEADEKTRVGLEQDWKRWVRRLFPDHVSDSDGDFVPFAKHHERFWRHIWSIRRGVAPPPTLFGLARGHAKSTSMELACIALGARGVRTYVLYVCGGQKQADEHVGNIQDAIEGSEELATLYPMMARRGVSAYGHSEGWNRNRLVTASGFVVDAIGLDTMSARGKKFRIRRPDVIVLDDIDDSGDSPTEVARKISALTDRVLPTGADDVAVLGGQNMIHPLSIFARLFGVADASIEEPDFLADRQLLGPIKAVEDLEYVRLPAGHPDGFENRSRYVITGGTPTWEGMDLAKCQVIVDREGIGAFRREHQHEITAPPGGMYDHIEFERCTWGEVPWAALERVVVWVDPAVTNHDGSDSHAIQADGLASSASDLIYRLFSWEGRTSPEDSLERAILKAVELGAEAVGVETDQGGDTWRSVFKEAKAKLIDKKKITKRQAYAIRFDSEKAGAGHGSKVHRNSHMLSDYERGRFVHVTGTHNVLERALKRFPKTKPLDLADAAYWSWYDLDSGHTEPASSESDSPFGGFEDSGVGFGRI